MRLQNKVAIVTGAASGIGKAIAEKFIKEGSKVVYSDINAPEDFETTENAFFIKCDVSNSKDVSSLIDGAIDRFGKIDIMVNNAGIGGLGGILDVTDENWDKTIGINLSGVMYGMREAANRMKESNTKGVIINMSSILGSVGFNGAIAYCAAKGGIVQLTHAGSLDLAQYKIRVNAIAPGFIETNMTRDILKDEKFNQLVTGSTPLGYVGEPNDIANAAVYLASDEAKYVTGNILYVDGGWTAK
jgi:meso-butanediol dehydrogenase/(S,S)-butanediol dehydrogenase/diacetyl reductase